MTHSSRTSRVAPAASHRSDPRLRIGLRLWLAAGLLALAALPAARGHHLWIGWLPFWLVLAPLSALAVAEHARLSSVVATFLVARQNRRKRARRVQARPLAGPQRGARRAQARPWPLPGNVQGW